MYTAQCRVHNLYIQCTLYIAHCILYIVYCTLYIVHCTLYIIHCTITLFNTNISLQNHSRPLCYNATITQRQKSDVQKKLVDCSDILKQQGICLLLRHKHKHTHNFLSKEV